MKTYKIIIGTKDVFQEAESALNALIKYAQSKGYNSYSEFIVHHGEVNDVVEVSK